jgi:hypothetical protein
MPYDAGKAWRRAFIYFAVCWLIAVPTEAFALLSVRVAAIDGLWWWGTGIGLIVSFVGYWIIWPMGTTTSGRMLHAGWASLFGVTWGVSEGVLLISVWAVVDDLVSPEWLAVALSFLLFGGLSAVWHARYWDVRIAPVHNIPEWDRVKVALVHSPFLLIVLVHIARYGQGRVAVAMYTVALVGASIAMRFPPPVDSAIGSRP